MYLDKLQQRTGQPIRAIFPDLSLLIHGGVNFAPYHNKLFNTLEKRIDTLELYAASEGVIALQNSQQTPGLLLQLNSGIFFEFIPVSEYFTEHPTRLCIEEVELGIDYAVILSTNAGLWGYSLGDTVKFVAKSPYKILVTGRIKAFYFCIWRACHCRRSRQGHAVCPEQALRGRTGRIYRGPKSKQAPGRSILP